MHKRWLSRHDDGKHFPVKGKLPPKLRPWQKKIPTSPSDVRFKRFNKLVVNQARTELEERATISPFAIIKVPAEKTTYFIDLKGSQSKWKGQVKNIVKKSNASHYAIITEGWIAPAKENIAPSKHPFRQDVIWITSYSRDGRKLMNIIHFDYISHNQVSIKKIGEWQKFDDNLVGDVFE